MKLNDYINEKIDPLFQKGGKYEKLWSVYDSFHTFLFVPRHTAARKGVQVHDSVDSKRVIIMVILAVIPAMLFGCWNVGYQHDLALGINDGWFMQFLYGFGAFLPKVVVAYAVGLGIEMAVACMKREEVAEGFLASGLLIPMIVPVETPLWMIAVATAFSVIFDKEIFGGTGMNIFNPALIARAFLFFSYPTKMSGDTVWVADDTIFGMGHQLADGTTSATPLAAGVENLDVTNAVIGLIPGSIGETSVIAIALGAIILLWTGVASWKTMVSVFVGGAATAALFHGLGMSDLCVCEHLVLGGFCFGAVFMATDPVTSCRTETGKYIYGFLIGAVAITVRVMNPGYPEGMMLAILLMNMFASTIDYYVVNANINKRAKRANNK